MKACTLGMRIKCGKSRPREIRRGIATRRAPIIHSAQIRRSSETRELLRYRMPLDEALEGAGGLFQAIAARKSLSDSAAIRVRCGAL